MTTIIATQAMLQEARKAYHSLMTGTSPRVVVDQNGEKVEFVAASAPKLYSYIQQLEQALRTPCGQAPAIYTQNGPATFLF